jgi:predicted dehydrogenase
MDKIRHAVLGLGIGKSHADAAANDDLLELAALCDIDAERLSALSAKYPSAKAYSSADELFADPDVDSVSICLPSSLHAEYAERAMLAGKHVLIEKPVDITPERARSIIEIRDRTGLVAAVVHQNRYNVSLRPIRAALEAGRLGKIAVGEFAVKWFREQKYFEGKGAWHGTWDVDGGGSLMNQAVHTVDLMLWLMGDAVSVSSQTGIFAHDIETEDATASVVRFRSGAMATFISTTCAYPGISTDIKLYGAGGSVEADADALKLWKLRDGADVWDDPDDEEEALLDVYGRGNGAYAARFATEGEPVYENGAMRPLSDACGCPATVLTGHAAVVRDFARRVLGDATAPIVSVEEAIRAVAFVCAVYESARTGKVVQL